MKQLRASLGAAKRDEIDSHIAERLEALPEFQQASMVLAYLSMGEEVDTRRIIRAAWAAGKTVAIPRCVPGERAMTWHVIESFEGLETSSFGIDEPVEDEATRIDPADCAIDALAIVPAFSFDEHGFRLGYGGGFYDVFLPTFPGTPIGLCREVQFSTEPIPTDAHDMAVAAIVTEMRTIRP